MPPATVSTPGLIAALVTIAVAVIVVRCLVWHVIRTSIGYGPHMLSAARGWRFGHYEMRIRTALTERHPAAAGYLGRRFDPTVFSGLTLTLMVVAAFCVGAALIGLVDDVYESEGLVRLDASVNALFAPVRAFWLLKAALWLTAIGAGPSLTAMILTATALFWSGARGRLIAPLWITFLGAQLTTWTSKYVIDRPRPTFLPSITEWNPSFPSGHATAVTALIGFLAYAVAQDRRDARQRYDAGFVGVCVIGLICFSRIFLGVHFLTDVLAGLLVGCFWLLVGVAVAGLSSPGQTAVPSPPGARSLDGRPDPRP